MGDASWFVDGGGGDENDVGDGAPRLKVGDDGSHVGAEFWKGDVLSGTGEREMCVCVREGVFMDCWMDKCRKLPCFAGESGVVCTEKDGDKGGERGPVGEGRGEHVV